MSTELESILNLYYEIPLNDGVTFYRIRMEIATPEYIEKVEAQLKAEGKL